MQTIANDIKTGSFHRVYLLYGEESYLKRSYKNQLKEALIRPNDTMNYHYFEGKGINPKSIIDLAETMPFLADFRFILIENSGFFKNSCDELAAYIKDIPETCVFLFVENEIDRRGKLYKAVKQFGYPTELAKQPEKGYHKKLFSKEPDFDNIEGFWDDFCFELYERIAPTSEEGSEDSYAFCRHILFKNEQFASSLVKSMWEKEFEPRISEIRELVKQVSLENQIQALSKCLIALDSTVLTLRAQIQTAESPCDPPPVNSDSLRELLKSLISFRSTCKRVVDGHVIYKLPNIEVCKVKNSDKDEKINLSEAFGSISRRGKKPKADKNDRLPESDVLLANTRHVYLAYLAKIIKMDSSMKESLKLEEQYISLQDYLKVSSSLKLEDLSEAIEERCKYHCNQVINYCMLTPEFNSDLAPNNRVNSYKDELIDALIYEYMSQALNCFNETIQLTAYHCAAQGAMDINDMHETLKCTHWWDHAERNIAESDFDIPYEPEALSWQKQSAAILRNWLYNNLLGFCKYFQKAWIFIYGDSVPLFVKGTYFFQNIDIASEIFWNGTKSASSFFSKEPPFSSHNETLEALNFCEQILFYPDKSFLPNQLLKNLTKILKALLLQILHKVVQDSVPKIREGLDPLFVR